MKENQHLKNLQEILKNYQLKILMIYWKIKKNCKKK